MTEQSEDHPFSSIPYDAVLTVRTRHRPGVLARFCAKIGDHGATIGDITTIGVEEDYNVREITVEVRDEAHLQEILDAIAPEDPFEVLEVTDRVFARHVGGKIAVRSRVRLETLSDLRAIYTPGVARVCQAIAAEPERAREWTGISNTVAIVTNGTRILGLGDIGPLAGMPVMEGKAAILYEMVGVSGVPILVDTEDVDAFIRTVETIAPTFGGIQLEDIRVPDCFEIEMGLTESLDIPVFHDDQHGTAMVTLATLLRVFEEIGVDPRTAVAGQIGLGAAGVGIASLLAQFGVKDLLGSDPDAGAQARFRERVGGDVASLEELMGRADVVVATTGQPGLISPQLVRTGQIVLALSNPIPEIDPEKALGAGARFAADGRSVNNLLGYPGLWKGLLVARADRITPDILLAGARAIARVAGGEGRLIPSPLDPGVHLAVAEAVERACKGSVGTLS